jgi:hypothetical protein
MQASHGEPVDVFRGVGVGVGKSWGVPNRNTVDSPVGMMNQPGRIAAVPGDDPDFHLKGIQSQIGSKRGGD